MNKINKNFDKFEELFVSIDVFRDILICCYLSRFKNKQQIYISLKTSIETNSFSNLSKFLFISLTQ